MSKTHNQPMWKIEVSGDTPFSTKYCEYVDKDIDLAELIKLSEKFPDNVLTLSAHARVRLSIQNGTITKNRPDLSDFYYLGSLNMICQALAWVSLETFPPEDDENFVPEKYSGLTKFQLLSKYSDLLLTHRGIK